jgi:hypothetical protein
MSGPEAQKDAKEFPNKIPDEIVTELVEKNSNYLNAVDSVVLNRFIKLEDSI